MSFKPVKADVFNRVEPVAIGVVAAWELLAFGSRGRVPTVTSTVCRLPRPYRRIVALMVAVWWWQHLDRR